MASFFKEIKPLMNSTIEASQAINRTAPILAWTQVLMIVLLTGIFLALFGLLVTLNPDLQAERQEFITPAVRILLEQGVALGRLVGRARGHARQAAEAVSASLPGRHVGAKTPSPSDSEKSGSKKSAKKNS
ncbi:hypothetical protein PFICI_07393 [Pestalotiopsis fici W106-1]|uniref:Uncharacterized protein n=1 Tax=Pestalotiopsis fici (strain W106-1 / CGMCC3.15140) TaxID=1229662 RepID=W3X1H3_PESFW|nr:uncharacterized protein PFICI_07393 [Pestalotiopsis fici W106-1]ETS79864.1 hypothetical protein PFICI_07393 [Pestalotiopsis fici W106-1]